MPIDGLTLHLLTEELNQSVAGTRIEKVYQPTADEVIFHLRSREGAMKLLINVSSATPHMNLTSQTPENPPSPPMLCMFMRKHLTGCIIESIEQIDLDRICSIKLTGRNEIGDPVCFDLIIELMPKHANLIILNSDGIILESVKKSDYSPTSGRAVLPGFKYVLPPSQNKINLLEKDTITAVNSILTEKGKLLSGSVLSKIMGISPLISREIACEVSGDDIYVSEVTDTYSKRLTASLDNLKSTVLSGGQPTLLLKENNVLFDVTFKDITQYGFAVNAKVFESYSLLFDFFFSEKSSKDRSSQQSRELLKTTANLISRANRKLHSRQKELEECADKDKYRIWAELILANQYALQKGSAFFDLVNYYENNETIRIPADPSLNPAGNAKKYFKEYNKLKNAEKLLGSLIQESKEEIEYLERVSDSLGRAEGYTDIAQIRAELAEQGYLKRKTSKKSAKFKPLPPIEYVSDDGYNIIVGRNNIQNEQISFKIADKSDSWFHTQKFPGSHVVVIGNGDIIPELTCRQAAIIAAYNSSARDSSQVAVDYTEIRELKKPSGAKPGKVIYHTYNTMWVTPDKDLCERLKKK